MDVEGMAEAERPVAVAGLAGVVGRDGGDEVGVDDPALHQVERAVAVIVAETVVVQVVLGAPQVRAPEHLGPRVP